MDVFKEQLAELLVEAKESLSSGLAVGSHADDAASDNAESDANTVAANLSNESSETVDTKSQPVLEKAIQMLQTTKAADIGISGVQTAGGSPNISMGSLGTEPSSDAEYYTPLGSPDESRRSSIAIPSAIVSLICPVVTVTFDFLNSFKTAVERN